MIPCPKCQKPMRFLKSITTLTHGDIVGIECPDESCAAHRVIPARQWLDSLQELKSWPDVMKMYNTGGGV